MGPTLRWIINNATRIHQLVGRSSLERGRRTATIDPVGLGSLRLLRLNFLPRYDCLSVAPLRIEQLTSVLNGVSRRRCRVACAGRTEDLGLGEAKRQHERLGITLTSPSLRKSTCCDAAP